MSWTITRRGDDVVTGLFRGAGAADVIAAFDAALQRALANQRRIRFVVLDFTHMPDFADDVAAPITSLLRGLTARGVVLVLGVSRDPFVRLTGCAVALTAQVPLVFTDTVGQADDVIAAQRRVALSRSGAGTAHHTVDRSMSRSAKQAA